MSGQQEETTGNREYSGEDGTEYPLEHQYEDQEEEYQQQQQQQHQGEEEYEGTVADLMQNEGENVYYSEEEVHEKGSDFKEEREAPQKVLTEDERKQLLVTEKEAARRKPALRVSGVDGATEEEIKKLFAPHYSFKVVFDAPKGSTTADVVLLWAETDDKNFDEVAAKVEKAKEDLHNTTFKDKKITVTDLPVDSLLFVGNIAPEVDREELRKLFAPYGAIMRAWIMRLDSTGESKSYGFVEFSSRGEASAAKLSLSSAQHRDRILRVDYCDVKEYESFHSTTLFVDRIPKIIKDPNYIRKMFVEYGPIKDVVIALNNLHQSRGFAFIDFENYSHAEAARAAKHGKPIGENVMRISYGNPGKTGRGVLMRAPGSSPRPPRPLLPRYDSRPYFGRGSLFRGIPMSYSGRALSSFRSPGYRGRSRAPIPYAPRPRLPGSAYRPYASAPRGSYSSSPYPPTSRAYSPSNPANSAYPDDPYSSKPPRSFYNSSRPSYYSSSNSYGNEQYNSYPQYSQYQSGYQNEQYNSQPYDQYAYSSAPSSASYPRAASSSGYADSYGAPSYYGGQTQSRSNPASQQSVADQWAAYYASTPQQTAAITSQTYYDNLNQAPKRSGQTYADSSKRPKY